MSPDAVLSNFCLGVILGSYKRLAARGCLLASPSLNTEREILSLAWALSDEVHEVTEAALGKALDRHDSQTVEVRIHSGQSLGALDACATQMQQHLTADPSLFVVRELVSSPGSLQRHQVVAWVLQRAQEALTRSLPGTPDSSRSLLEQRLAEQRAALARPALRKARANIAGRRSPGQAALNSARRSQPALFAKAAEALCRYDGLQRFAPFALRRLLNDMLFKRLASQRLFELAVGLALAEALSVVSGQPLTWNSSLTLDGVIATVGPFFIGWQEPSVFEADVVAATLAVSDSRSQAYLSFVQGAAPADGVSENAAIRAATEALVLACRKEALKGPRFEELPLAHCAVVMRRLFNYVPEAPSQERLLLTDFSEVPCGRLLELARRVCHNTALG